MKIDLSNLPSTVKENTPTEGDGLEVGNVYWNSHKSYFNVIYRLTPSSAHVIRFRVSDGSFDGACNKPMRSVFRREYLVGKVKNMQDIFTLSVEWEPNAFKGRKLSI